MPISYVGAVNGTTTATLPAHQAGDVIIAFAYRDGSTTAPTVPAGWTTIASGTGGGGSSNASALAYKVAASSAETVGTFTNATNLVIGVYRGCRAANPIGGNATTTGSSTTITYPAVTMARGDGSSWVVGASGHRSTNVAIETAPAGMTFRTAQSNATAESALFDTNAGVASWSAATASVGGTASNWIARTVELLAIPTKRVVLCT